jgi:ribonuclease E
MAIEPKTPRKRAVKKASAKAEATVTEVTSDEVKKPARKKTAAVPVPIFQAAPDEPIAKTARKKVAAAPKAQMEKSEAPAAASSENSEDQETRNRRRRRGGRGRRKPGSDVVGGNEESTESSEESAEGSTHRRRRRRVAGSEGVTAGESVVEDGVVTVVKVREVRERPVRPARTERAERTERRGGRTARTERNDRGGRTEYREPYRKRGTIITDGEFLARRENVDREMLVRQIADRTQIAVIEDGVMVEHYVNRNSNVSYVGNVYLGRVQNVLPSMEAAFVDIGKGRNAVLYAGEVNWDAAGISESQPRKIETVLKSGQSVLVQVTKDPIGQKGARLTSQISLPGRYVVYVPGGGMSGISKRLPESERTRLKAILKNLIPETAGVIVRTAAEGVSEEDLTSDVARLKAQWDDIYAKSENPNFHPPAALYQEPDLAVRVIRDIFNEDFRKLTVQGSSYKLSRLHRT